MEGLLSTGPTPSSFEEERKEKEDMGERRKRIIISIKPEFPK